MAAANILEVGGRRYAVGLRWVPSQDAVIKKAAVAAAARRHADLYVVRPPAGGRLGQYGLGLRAHGHRAGMQAAAAILVAGHRGSWAGVWRTKGGWWLLVVREDLIESDGDVLFDAEDDARARLDEEISQGGLDRIFAPAAWEIVGSEGTQLPILLSGAGRAHKLLAARSGGGRAILLVVAGVAVVGVAWFATKPDGPRELPKFSAPVPSVDRDAQIARLALWKVRPAARAWGAACQRVIDQVPWKLTGWALSGLVCGENAVSLSWVRSNGPAVVPEGARVDLNGRSASREISLGDLPNRADEQLLGQLAITHQLLVSPLRPEMLPLPDDMLSEMAGTEERKVPAPWSKRKINVKLPRWPWPAIAQLGQIQGLVVNSMKLGPNGWDLEATIYEARDQ